MDYALIVGICYKGTQGELKGPKEDVTNMTRLLVDKFGFKKNHIHVLSEDVPGPLPTRENVMKELEKFVCHPDLKRFFFYFSGHGSKIRNNDISKLDNEEKDQVIMCLNGEYIVDDEMYEIFQKFKKGTKVFSLVDSCFSGTISDLPFIYDGEKVQKTKRREIPANVVQLSSSLDIETSADLGYGGAMTLKFIESVKDVDRITYFELLEKISEKVKNWQTPYLSSSYKLNSDSTFFCQQSEKPYIRI